MTRINTHRLTVPLGNEAHNYAQQFASQQSTPEKAKRVYLNTLAVYAVRSYLKWLAYETDLAQSDSWHPVVRGFHDVADLVIPDLGKLECRPVLPGETIINLPSEAIEDRIGYIAVEFQEKLNEVELLGFVSDLEPNNEPNQILISQLQSLENLIDYLDRLESGKEFIESDDSVAIRMRERLDAQSLAEIIAQMERIYRTYDREEWRYAGGNALASCIAIGSPVGHRELLDDSQRFEVQDLAEELLEKLDEIWGVDSLEKQTVDSVDSKDNKVIQTAATITSQTLTNLGQWLQNIVEAGWETVEDILGTEKSNLVFTPTRFAASERVVRAKLIYLEMQPTGTSLALVVAVAPTGTQERQITIQVNPTESNTLPAGLTSVVLDTSGQVIWEEAAKNAAKRIQLNINGKPGEQFRLKVFLGEASVTKDFVI